MLLAFDDNGPGPVVVLLHGFPFDRSMWSYQRSKVGSVYRVITPDLRGHGESAAPDGTYTIESMADDVLELLDALQIYQPIVIGGHSMGGYLALSIAIHHPERIKALLLINSRAAADSPDAAEVRERTAQQIEASGDTEPAIASMLPRLFSRETFEHHPQVVAKTHKQMAKTPARAMVGTLRGLATRPNRLANLPAITVPTLILSGVEDQLVPFEEIEQVARLMPNAQLVKIPNAGHVAPLENPEATNTAIFEFLQSLE